MTWSDLIGLQSWLQQVQLAYRHNTRPFLPLVKGLARQTSSNTVDTGWIRACPRKLLYCDRTLQYWVYTKLNSTELVLYIDIYSREWLRMEDIKSTLPALAATPLRPVQLKGRGYTTCTSLMTLMWFRCHIPHLTPTQFNGTLIFNTIASKTQLILFIVSS